MKIYIAAGFNRIEEVNLLAKQIEVQTPHKVISHWHRPGFETGKKALDCAMVDVEDIRNCDLLLSLGGATTQGGRHVELGMAWILNIPILHLGEHESVFHYLPGIDHVPNRGSLFDALLRKYVDPPADLEPVA